MIKILFASTLLIAPGSTSYAEHGNVNSLHIPVGSPGVQADVGA